MRKLVLAMSVVVAACGGGTTAETPGEISDPTEAPAATGAVAVTPSATAVRPSPGGDTPPPANGSGSGHISLTIGDQTWEFDGALCAYMNAPAGEAGSEWNVSFKQEQLQVYVNQDATGPSVSLTNVVDFGSLRWNAEGDAVEITVSGNDIAAGGRFTDETGGPERDGTLDATCASWVDAT